MKTKVKTTRDIGAIIKEARLQRKMTLISLANKAGYSFETISSIEKNRWSPRIDTLLNVAEVVGVTMELTIDKVEA